VTNTRQNERSAQSPDLSVPAPEHTSANTSLKPMVNTIGGWELPPASFAFPSPPAIRPLSQSVQTPDDRPNLMWLEDVYSFVASGKKRKAIAVLFREMDELLSSNQFELCDSIIASTLDLNRLNASLLIAVLSITLPASSKLKSRADLVERIRRRLKNEVPERAERMLKGLE